MGMNKTKIYIIGFMLIVSGLIFLALSGFTKLFLMLGSAFTGYGVALILRKKYGWRLK